MRLTRDDLTPLLAIVVAGSVGVAGTVSLLVARSAPVLDSTLRSEYDPLYEWQPTFERAVPMYDFGAFGELIEEIEDLQTVQHDLVTRARTLWTLDAAARSEEIADVRASKEAMIQSLGSLERQLSRTARRAPALDSDAARSAIALLLELRLSEKIRYSEAALQEWDRQSLLTLEQQIEADLYRLREQFGANWTGDITYRMPTAVRGLRLRR